MSIIENYIAEKNKKNEKVLSIFLTAGFPDKNKFTGLALKILNAGADMLEIGFPFSDPLADGPTIQYSSKAALENGINLVKTFEYAQEIRKETDKPLIMMGYANPVLSYGIKNFASDAQASGVNGVIIPDVPIEEYDYFFDGLFGGLDTILLITPTTNGERIKAIDEKGKGFIYCVSISGTTGTSYKSTDETIQFLKSAYSSVKKNKMLVGFGISNADDAKKFAPYCDGVIVGSAIIKSLRNDTPSFGNTVELVRSLKACLIPE